MRTLNLHIKLKEVKIMDVIMCIHRFYFSSFFNLFRTFRKLHPGNLFTTVNMKTTQKSLTQFQCLVVFIWVHMVCNVSICMRFYFGNIFFFLAWMHWDNRVSLVELSPVNWNKKACYVHHLQRGAQSVICHKNVYFYLIYEC